MANKLKLNEAGKAKFPEHAEREITAGSWSKYLNKEERESFLVAVESDTEPKAKESKSGEPFYVWTNKGEYHERFREDCEGMKLNRKGWNKKLGINMARILIATGTLEEVQA